MIREVEHEGTRFRVDTGPQVLGLECPEDVVWRNPGLAPSVAALGPRGFVSAAVLAAKAKAFDDGLMAAVDLAAQEGAGTFPGKKSFLPGMPGDIAAAARHLGLGAAVTGEAAKLVESFLADEKASKPLGFYTWSAALEKIFRQDRMLQSEFPDEASFAAAAKALHADPGLRRAYVAWMSLNERLTNPFTRPDLRTAAGSSPKFERGVAWAPPSESPEGALVKRLYGNRPIPDGFNLADKLIEEIRRGGVSLEPAEKSGWYDRIAWSLETIAAPERGAEAKKLDVGKEYRRTLEALFKGILALARESHVKQLEEPRAGCGPPAFRLHPELSVEPLPTHYLRRAVGYRFVREVLESTFGAAALRDLKRQSADGPSAASLDEELAFVERLFAGAHCASCGEIGLEAQTGREDEGLFRKWAAEQATDRDLATDNRMMVPVFYDMQRKQTKVWVFLGWTERPLQAWFKVPPRVEAIGGAPKKSWFSFAKAPPGPAKVEFDDAKYPLFYPVTAEVYVSKRLNREEFRKLCDEQKTEERILASLK